MFPSYIFGDDIKMEMILRFFFVGRFEAKSGGKKLWLNKIKYNYTKLILVIKKITQTNMYSLKISIHAFCL